MPVRRTFAWLSLALPLALALLAAPPLGAGTVYVSLAADGELDGLFYETTLVVTNPTGELRFLALDFVPGVINGSRLNVDLEPAIHGVPPRETRVLTKLTRGLGTFGLLEVTGDDRLVVDARLRISNQAGLGAVVQLPVISSSNQFEGGKLTVMPGWYRDVRRRSSLGLVNLSEASNQCSVDILGLQGNALVNRVTLNLPPLALVYWSDALGAAGVTTVAEARLQLTCSEPWYAFSLLADRASGALVRRDASSDLASTLKGRFANGGADDAGDPGDPGAVDPGGARGAVVETGPGLVRLRVPGVVHAPARGRSGTWIYELDLPGISTIDSITAEVVIEPGPWGTLRDRPQHHLLQISRARWGDGGWDYWVRPDRSPGVVMNGLLATRGRNAGNEVVRGTLSRLPARYRLRAVQDGRTVAVEGLALGRSVVLPRSGPLFIQLGADLGIREDPMVPSHGWVWRDLVVEVRGR